MRESTIEKTVCEYARKKGCTVMKLAGPNQKGQPDRMILYLGRTMFIEFKAPGKKPTALQDRWLRQLRKQGFGAYPCDDSDYGKKLIDILTE